MAAKTSRPMMAKPNKGPGKPTSGRTNIGAMAGPMMVPRPKDEASADKALTRAERRVFEAR